MLTVAERVLVLVRGPLATAPTLALARLAALGEEVLLDVGDAAFAPGDPPAALHLVLDGVVDVSGDPGAVLARERRTAGEPLDAAAVFAGRPRAARAVAVTPVRLLRVDRDELWELLAEEGELCRALLAWVVHASAPVSDDARAG